MAYVTRKSAVIYVTEEVTEGTAVDPTLGSQAVGVLEDNFELNPEKELVERNNLTSSIAQTIPRTGIKTSSVTLGVEGASSDTEGSEPDYGLLMQSALGATRSSSAAVTSGTGHTTTTVNIDDTDISEFSVGDIVVIKESGAYHTSPIAAVDATPGSANITLLVAGGASFSDAVEIAKFTTYYGESSGHKSLTVTKFLEDAIKTQAAGCKVSSLSLEGFETGQLSSFVFGLTGLGFAETLAASGLTPSFGNAAPPIILDACLYLDGDLLGVNSFAVSVENTLGRVTTTCSDNGIITQLPTNRAISGSLVPYMDTTDVSLYNKFDLNTEFSLFVQAHIPTGTAGEYENSLALFIPKCIITALPKGEQDGIMQYNLEFQAGSDSSGTYSSDIYISFS